MTRMLAIADQRGCTLWDVENGSPQGLADAACWPAPIAYSPDGSMLACIGEAGAIRLSDANSGKLVVSLPAGLQRSVGLSVSFVSRSLLAVSGGDPTVQLWDLASKRRKQSRDMGADVYAFAVSGPRNALASVSWKSHAVSFTDLGKDGVTLGTPAHELSTWAVAFRPDGEMIASADNTIVLWDTHTLDRVGSFKAALEGVRALAFSPDGKALASGDYQGKVMLWNVDLQTWQHRACELANRNLTEDEWRRYLGDRGAYRTTCPGNAAAH